MKEIDKIIDETHVELFEKLVKQQLITKERLNELNTKPQHPYCELNKSHFIVKFCDALRIKIDQLSMEQKLNLVRFFMPLDINEKTDFKKILHEDAINIGYVYTWRPLLNNPEYGFGSSYDYTNFGLVLQASLCNKN
jgi:hypothetical protein